jgi:hypothetical protein
MVGAANSLAAPPVWIVARYLGTGGVLILDEPADLKKGQATAGVGRQYTGTVGRIENAIVAVCATYAAARGHALIDRKLTEPDPSGPLGTKGPQVGPHGPVAVISWQTKGQGFESPWLHSLK